MILYHSQPRRSIFSKGWLISVELGVWSVEFKYDLTFSGKMEFVEQMRNDCRTHSAPSVRELARRVIAVTEGESPTK